MRSAMHLEILLSLRLILAVGARMSILRWRSSHQEGAVHHALGVGLLRVVVGAGGKYQPDDALLKFPTSDFVDILEEAPPGRTEIWWIMGVDGGDETEALGQLVGLVVDMGILY